MNFRNLGVGMVVMLAITLFWVGRDILQALNTPDGFHIATTDEQLVAYGRTLYVSHCAACHGSTLEGQENWRERHPDGRLPAPPHDESGHTWHHPDAVLFDITRNGMVPGHTAPKGYESNMPAYAGILSDQDIVAVIAYIKSTWSAEIRALHDEVNRNHWQGGAR